MGIRVDVLPLSENTPGQGWLRISGWEDTSEGLAYSVQSSQTRDFLQPGKQWSNVAHGFPLSGLVAVDGALQVQVGPELIDPLLAASGSANFRFELNSQVLDLREATMLRLDKQLVSSIAWTGVKAPDPVPAPAPTRAPEPVVEAKPLAPVVEAPVQPEPAPEPPQAPAPVAAKKINRLVWLLPLLALIITAGLWWFLQKPAMVDEPTLPAPTPSPAPTPDAQPCTLESMQSQPELAFVQACIQKAPGSAALLEVINLAKANNHCAVAQRLYANRAQGGDIEIASAYAREYDPKYHQASECFRAPDNATAAYWYETILGFDPNNAEAKQRFEELKP